VHGADAGLSLARAADIGEILHLEQPTNLDPHPRAQPASVNEDADLRSIPIFFSTPAR
jgi:hypothetical protein